MASRNRTPVTRARILQAALGEFAHSGFDGASMQRVSEAAGVAHGTVYWHFQGKSGLYLAVVQHASEDFHAEVARFADAPAASFMDVVGCEIEYRRVNPQIGAILSSLCSAHPRADANETELMRQAARMVDDGFVDVWRRWIETRRSPNTARISSAATLARLIASTVSGLLATRFIDPRLDVRAPLAQFATLVETALADGRHGPAATAPSPQAAVEHPDAGAKTDLDRD